MKKIGYFTTRFEFEIEVIVKAAWSGISVISVPIQIYYAKGEERVTHFRPTKDFARISLLNTYLVILAFAWYKPMRILKGLRPSNLKAFIIKHIFNENESIQKKSLSVTVGIFFGIVPIWGYQLISAIAAAYFFKLNKAIVILTANISIPIFLPFILYASLKTGELVTKQQSSITITNISLENIKSNLFVYMTGACVLSVVLSIFLGLVTFVLLTSMKNKKTVQK